MRSFYHCKTYKITRRAAKIIGVTATICAETAAIAFFFFFFGIFATPRGEPSLRLIVTAAAVTAGGAAFCLFVGLRAKKRVRRLSRYTYLDIQLKALVVSFYASDYTIWGERFVMRDLYYVPFSGISSVYVSQNGKKTVITGNIRKYFMKSDSLGYHVKNGDIEFDRDWLNFGAYKSLPYMEIPACFGPPERIFRAVTEAKKRFNELPKPKPHIPPRREPPTTGRRTVSPGRNAVPDSLALKKALDAIDRVSSPPRR